MNIKFIIWQKYKLITNSIHDLLEIISIYPTYNDDL